MFCKDCGKKIEDNSLFCADYLTKRLGLSAEAVHDHSTEDQDKTQGNAWFKFLDIMMKIPGIKVNREEFLEKEFHIYTDSAGLQRIKEEGTGRAGISLEIMDKTADKTIAGHTALVTATFFLSGIPGGLALLGTVLADLAQFYFHLIVSVSISYHAFHRDYVRITGSSRRN